VVLNQVVAAAVHVALAPGEVDDVVGYQPVPAHDQVQRNFALADA
jgi:hypothetical protein